MGGGEASPSSLGAIPCAPHIPLLQVLKISKLSRRRCLRGHVPRAPGGAVTPSLARCPRLGRARICDLGLHSSPSTQRTGPIYKIQVHMLKPSLPLVLSFTGYSFRKLFPMAATPARGLLTLPCPQVSALLPASSASADSSPASLQSVPGGRGGADSRAGVKAGKTHPSFALS